MYTYSIHIPNASKLPIYYNIIVNYVYLTATCILYIEYHAFTHIWVKALPATSVFPLPRTWPDNLLTDKGLVLPVHLRELNSLNPAVKVHLSELNSLNPAVKVRVLISST